MVSIYVGINLLRYSMGVSTHCQVQDYVGSNPWRYRTKLRRYYHRTNDTVNDTKVLILIDINLRRYCATNPLLQSVLPAN